MKRMKNFIQFSFFICLFIGCKPHELAIKCDMIIVENDRIESTLTLYNHSIDTFSILKELNFLPRDKDTFNPSIELFHLNGKKEDIIASKDFDFTLVEDFFLFDEDQKLKTLLPKESHSYNFGVSNYYPPLNKGKYLLKVYIKPHLGSLQDTCVLGRFELKKDQEQDDFR